MSIRTLPVPQPIPWTSSLTGDYPGQQSQITLPGGVPMVFCWCPPPRPVDQLGTPEDEPGRYGDEQAPHAVPFKQGFWLAKHPVNQVQWRAVMNDNPAEWKGDELPVESVSWQMAQVFCKKTKLHLPTEAMWEYACRAGSRTPFSIGNGIDLDSQQANFDGSMPYGNGFEWLERTRTTAQGSFPPNDWGLHDMHGQLWEWCEDFYGESDRVLRGGSWVRYGLLVRSGFRSGYPPGYRDGYFGFRPSPSSIPSSQAGGARQQ